ncbi:auxilin-related protein 2 isoform X2 [Castanea sativa]|uniref:auxilin-related protein 2 isoform X2 n=1 Tax=Castanea sativa TaxID=21020 RepID=UPI003F64B69E
MNDFEGLLASDFGFKPQGKSAPMAGSKSTSATTVGGSSTRPRSSSNSFEDRDSLFTTNPQQKPQDFGSGFGDLFGSARYATKSETTAAASSSFNFDMFRDSGAPVKSSSSSSAPPPPVYDKPVYDDDIFDGVPGLKSSSASAKYEDVFTSVAASSSPPKRSGSGSDAFDDLLGGFGKVERESKGSGVNVKRSQREEKKSVPDFDDLLPGFGGSRVPSERPTSETSWSSEPTVNAARSPSSDMEDPFKILESTTRPVVSSPEHFVDPLEEISKLNNSRSTKSEDFSAANGGVYDDADPFEGLGKSVPAFSSERNNKGKDKSPSRTDTNASWNRTSTSKESIQRTSVRSPESHSQRKTPVQSDQESHQTPFDMPTFSSDSHKSFGQTASPPSYVNASSNEANVHVDMSPRSEENLESSEDVWLTVSEIPLFTQPTSAPPPSRPPPPRPVQVSNSRGRSGSPAYTNSRKMNEYNSFPNSARFSQGPKSASAAASDSVASPFDDLEDFATGRSQNNVDESANGVPSEELEMNSVAAAMKEAMDKAEAKFRHAREVRERESTKAARSRDTVQLEKDERTTQDERVLREKQERIDRERLQRERAEEEREQKRLQKERERAREIEREREEKEREQRRLEKERERARQAVERATREARERAAIDARLRAEKAAVEKANSEARERAERAAVQRAQAEARERAAADAKERAERAATEAKERAAVARAEAEARVRAERAAVERAAAEARERAAAAARMNQQKNENDLESFFSMGRASSVPRPRGNSSNRQEPEVARKSATASTNIRKANSATNIVDDLSSIFGAAPSSGEFQDVEGETEDRRRARLERHQRTQERAAKALAEKNERDLQTQREQAERHRIAETLDAEIKRWASGKEGNLRALLSTMQYVLWPECGWQPVSLTDMITGPAVKKAYRKATLCIHPDKVQQKGATLQQKYVAEKVFDLLKEAWNKFNSEELF